MKPDKPKKTLKEKILEIRDKVKTPILYFLALLPVLGLFAYALPFPMLNLWDLFVEYLFGSFWLAVLFIMLIFFLILMMGGVSYFTVILFEMYFFLAMIIGYGYPLFTVAIAVFAVMYCIFQVFKWLENR